MLDGWGLAKRLPISQRNRPKATDILQRINTKLGLNRGVTESAGQKILSFEIVLLEEVYK
jgi:hypothetical protein